MSRIKEILGIPSKKIRALRKELEAAEEATRGRRASINRDRDVIEDLTSDADIARSAIRSAEAAADRLLDQHRKETEDILARQERDSRELQDSIENRVEEFDAINERILNLESNISDKTSDVANLEAEENRLRREVEAASSN